MPDRCLLCAHPTGRLVVRKPEVALRRCDRCHFVQQDPVPEPVAYDERYEHAGGSYGVELMRDKQLFLRRDERVVRTLASAGASGPLLDVGAGAGILLEAARNVGWDAIGLELARASVDDIRTRLKLDVHACAIEDAPLAAGSIGTVTFSHSLEHLLDPVRALRAAWRVLRPGGFVHVAVPHWRSAKRW